MEPNQHPSIPWITGPRWFRREPSFTKKDHKYLSYDFMAKSCMHRSPLKSSFHNQLIQIGLFLLLLMDPTVLGCGPGRGGGRRRSPRKLTPLVFKQHVPNVSENTLGASGLTEGKISRENPKFKELVPNYNPDIIFRDEEGTGADRLMTQRLKEKINMLAISVMNQWPGVKLRVTEGWDEDGLHALNSLHYEGRAVDITTSVKDGSKYRMLARLAVEAGFDWVYYESRWHIHCSVKSEKSDTGRSGGCFNGESNVCTKRGNLPMESLQVGDEILVAETDGTLRFSEVILFMDRDPSVERLFLQIETDSGYAVTLTPSHLVFVAESNTSDFASANSTFAVNVQVGQFLFVVSDEISDKNFKTVKPERIVKATETMKKGVYAPLTRQGNLLVNNVVASCYAVIDDQTIAHYSFLPVRILENLKDGLSSLATSLHLINSKSTLSRASENAVNGVHWYPRALYSISKYIIPPHLMYK